MATDEPELLIRNKIPIPCKIILVGESGVGKTSIISRYIKNLYNDRQPPTLSPLNLKKNIIIDGYMIKTLSKLMLFNFQVEFKLKTTG
jgi:GTPase SAR1 family protein